MSAVTHPKFTGYQFTLDCPSCGSQLEHCATGTTTGLDTRAVAVCTGCRCQIRVQVTVSLAGGRHQLLSSQKGPTR